MSQEPVSKGGRTQADIVQAAYRLFVGHGYHATSMRQIAKEADIALGGIYNHFASKEDIFQAVLIEFHPYQQILEVLEASSGESVEEIIRDGATLMVATLGQRSDFLNLVFIELVEFKGKHLQHLFELIFPRVMSFAQRLLAGRQELRSIPLPVVIRAYLGLFFSYYISEMFLARLMPVDMPANTLDYFVDIYLRGILRDGSLPGAEAAS
jgi:AcrR family transcriptional regulator